MTLWFLILRWCELFFPSSLVYNTFKNSPPDVWGLILVLSLGSSSYTSNLITCCRGVLVADFYWLSVTDGWRLEILFSSTSYNFWEEATTSDSCHGDSPNISRNFVLIRYYIVWRGDLIANSSMLTPSPINYNSSTISPSGRLMLVKLKPLFWF